MAYTVVTIPLDPQPTLRLIGTPAGDIVERRRHEVRGHYCHNEAYRRGTAMGCIHEWEQDPDRPDDAHWKCTSCEGKRWHRRVHTRGSAEVGYSDKLLYRVTA